MLMPVRVPGPVEVPWVGRGRYRMAHGRACSATGISAVGRGGPKTLCREATADVGAVGRGVPGTLSSVQHYLQYSRSVCKGQRPKVCCVTDSSGDWYILYVL